MLRDIPGGKEMRHPYIGFLDQGDIIRPVNSPQDSLVISRVCFDPAQEDGSPLVYVTRVDNGKEVSLSMRNIYQWFLECQWERINKK